MLVGILIARYNSEHEEASVEVPGNIITPNKAVTSASRGFPIALNAAAASGSDSTAIALHNKQPEDNTPFQVRNIFPGDAQTKNYCVKVSYNGNIVVRYHADIRPGYEKLAEVLKVKIRLPDTNELLYDGLMRDMPQSLEHPLYTSKSMQSELYYEITAYLDTSVGNEYQDKELIADFRWWVEENDHLDSPKTGNTSNTRLWICIACVSLLLIPILLSRRRKEAEDEVE